MSDVSETSTSGKGKAFIRAVPWKTSTEDKVKGALGEIPAYVRRAKSLEDAVDALHAEARTVRESLLGFVCLRLRRVIDVDAAGGLPDAIEREVVDLDAFRRLPSRPRAAARPKERELALDALRGSIRRFNANWEVWIREEAPLARVNRHVEGYNRHFRLERQCALRYVPFSKVRFERMQPTTPEDLFDRYPALPIP